MKHVIWLLYHGKTDAFRIFNTLIELTPWIPSIMSIFENTKMKLYCLGKI